MFTHISARNFKSWRELPATPLAPITGFFGGNSSGKTSILQLLLLMKQTAAATDRFQPLQFGQDGSAVELGSFRDVIYRHDVESGLEVGFGWRLREPLVIADPISVDRTLLSVEQISFNTRVEAAVRSAQLVVDHFEYSSPDCTLRLSRSSSKHGRKTAEYELGAEVKGRSDYLRRTPGRPWPLPAPVKCYGFPDETVAYFQNSGFTADFELAFDRQLTSRTYYLGPLRSNPARQYRWQGTRPQDVGVAGERAVEALLASREAGRTNTRGFDTRGHAKRRITVEEHVAQWLKQLGLIERFSAERLSEDADLYRVIVQKTMRSTPVALTDVGFGVS